MSCILLHVKSVDVPEAEKLTSEDVYLLEAEAVLGKALKRLEQGGTQQAAAAQERIRVWYRMMWNDDNAVSPQWSHIINPEPAYYSALALVDIRAICIHSCRLQ